MQEEQFLKVALAAVKKAELIFRKSFAGASGVLQKNDLYKSPVTDIDKEIETIITKELLKNFPDHSISGEEFPPQKNSSAYTWHIDPIDGTINYIRGLTGCSISLGLWKGDEPIVGVVSDPVSGILYSAARGQGAFKNGKQKLSVSGISELGGALGLAGQSKDEKNDESLKRVGKNCYRNREFGGAAIQISYIAEGKMEFYLSDRAKIYDVAASALILSESGGKFTDWQGNPFTSSSRQFVASNGKIHDEIIALLK